MTEAEHSYEVTPRTKVRRAAERGRYDAAFVHSVLDEAFICHVGFTIDDQPYVIPTIHARDGEVLYIHGSVGSRMLKAASQGARLCVTVTLVDGLVMARSAFHHSMNYRSVVILGTATAVTDNDGKMTASKAVTEHVWPGRWEDTRWPNPLELRKTTFLRMDLSEVSAKTRTGPPKDDEEDYGLPHWAGVIPVSTSTAEPEADPDLAPGIELPGYLRSPRLS